MKILDRYVAATFFKNFGVALLSLISLYLFQALLGDLLEGDYPPQLLLIYHLLDAPSVMVQMTPPAVLLGTVLTLSGLNRSNELVACYSIGLGLGRLMAVILSLVFMVACFTLVLQDRILPLIYKKRTTFYWREMKKRPDFYLDVKQDKIWYRSKNLIYNLRSFDAKSRTIFGMAVYTFDDEFNLIQVVDAQKATFTPQGWKLANGTVTVFGREEQFPLTQKFSEKDLMINETPKDFQEIEKEVDGLRLKELWRYIVRTREAGTDTTSYEVKLHARMSLSFIPLVMCLLGVPFSIRNKREGGMGKDLALCLGTTFFYWLFYSISLSLGTNGDVVPWFAAWFPSAVFLILAFVLIARKESLS